MRYRCWSELHQASGWCCWLCWLAVICYFPLSSCFRLCPFSVTLFSPVIFPTMSNHKSDLSTLCDSFNSQAATYARRIGGSTREVMIHVIPLLGPQPEYSIFLDNACGPGFVTEKLIKAFPEAKVYAADVAPRMISLLKSIVEQCYKYGGG